MTDHALLQTYAAQGASAQAAFAELVARHLNLVYSAARRQVPHLADDIAQSVFLDLARHAPTFPSDQPLAPWLHVVTRRTAVDTIRRESRRAARETTAAQLADTDAMPPSSPSPWSAIAPHVDEAVAALPDTDRTAILLRYFENKSLREIGAALGTTDDAAQKRVSRALDQLRTALTRRGLTVTAAGLATDLSAHAILTAPVALGVAISTTAGAITAGTTAAIVMTTVQKTALATAFALVFGTGLYEATLLARQRDELAAVRGETSDLSSRLHRANQQAALTARQLANARDQLRALSTTTAPNNPSIDPAAEAEMRAWLERASRLKQFARESGKSIPELALLAEKDWLNITQHLDRFPRGGPLEALDEALRGARGLASVRFGFTLGEACRAYVKAHDGQLPPDVPALAPYLKDNKTFKASAVDETMLARYAMRYTGALSDVPADERSAVIIQIGSPDEEHDQRSIVGPGGGNISTFADLSGDTKAALRAYTKTTGNTSPANAAELLPYFRPPLSPGRQEKFLQTSTALLPR